MMAALVPVKLNVPQPVAAPHTCGVNPDMVAVSRPKRSASGVQDETTPETKAQPAERSVQRPLTRFTGSIYGLRTGGLPLTAETNLSQSLNRVKLTLDRTVRARRKTDVMRPWAGLVFSQYRGSDRNQSQSTIYCTHAPAEVTLKWIHGPVFHFYFCRSL